MNTYILVKLKEIKKLKRPRKKAIQLEHENKFKLL